MLSQLVKNHQASQAQKREELGKFIFQTFALFSWNFKFTLDLIDIFVDFSRREPSKGGDCSIQWINSGTRWSFECWVSMTYFRQKYSFPHKISPLSHNNNRLQCFLNGLFWHRVAQAYLNQKRLDAEAKQLHTSATNFAKQTQQWMNLIEGFSSALKVFHIDTLDNRMITRQRSIFITKFSSFHSTGDWWCGKLGAQHRKRYGFNQRNT